MIRVSWLGSTIEAAASRAVLSEPTSVKALVAALKIWPPAVELVEVARLIAPPSLPPESPPATRMLPASGPGVGDGDAPVVEVEVAVAAAVEVAVPVDVAVAVCVAVAVAVAVAPVGLGLGGPVAVAVAVAVAP